MVSWPVWADRLTWLGVTPDWEKRHKDRHTEKLGTRWAQHSWWEMPVTPSAYKCIYLYSRCGKAEWKAGRVLMGPVTRQQEQHSCGMLLFTADYPLSTCPVFPARRPCWALPPLGWVRAYQPRGPLTEPCSCQGLSPLPQFPYLQGSLAEPCSPPLCRGPCLLSTKVFHTALHM
jgi:hypothetical protein